MKKGRVRFENRGLWVLLGVLCVMIVGLGVVVISLEQSDSNGDEEVYGQTSLEASIANGYYPSDEISLEAYEYNYDYLTRMIESRRTDDEQQLDNSQVLFLRMALIRLMIQYGKIQEALDYLNNIDQDNLSDDEMMTVFTSYSLIYQEMGDKEKSLMYANKAVDINDKINNEDGNGE